MKQKIIAGNWKMNLSLEEATDLASELMKNIPVLDSNTKIILAPPFVYLSAVLTIVKGNSSVSVSAQNCSDEAKGAFTGEISAPMLRSIGVTHVIIGHSERRKLFGETNSMLAKKVNIALSNGLSPIFCIGETLSERKENKYFETAEKQLNESLFHLDKNEFSKLILAYEPVWAIGTGLNATPAEAQEMHQFIRSLVNKKYGSELSGEISILYGGSCNVSNAGELFSMKDVDGGLIGGASLKASEFIQIIQSA